jgi:hypothetical protein
VNVAHHSRQGLIHKMDDAARYTCHGQDVMDFFLGLFAVFVRDGDDQLLCMCVYLRVCEDAGGSGEGSKARAHTYIHTHIQTLPM